MILLDGDGENQRLLFVKRAAFLKAHPGEIAFPGGKWEPGDDSLLNTALRETMEEVNVSADHVSIVGELPEGMTRKGVVVKPYVGVLNAQSVASVRPNCSEITQCLWGERKWLVQDNRVRTDTFCIGNQFFWSPAYRLEEDIVWGLTARFLVEFMNHFWMAGIDR